MSDVITVIYEQGLLRPLEPLALAENSQVKIQILDTTSAEDQNDLHKAEAVLIAAGLIQPLSPPAQHPHISTERREALANLYATGGPLSDIVIAERQGR